MSLARRRARVFTPENPARVLVVDDEPLMRVILAEVMSCEPRLRVVGEAGDATEAEASVARLAPDVLTLDIEMPGQSGLDFLTRLDMLHQGLPVVLVSGKTRAGSVAAVRGLARGAVDFIAKPQRGIDDVFVRDMCARILSAASARRHRPGTPAAAAVAPARPAPAPGSWNGRAVFIGASTGGVQAIETILSALPGQCPPIAIAQHMPAMFLASFAERLDAMLPMQVTLARDGDRLKPGRVLVAPGGDQLCTARYTAPDWRLQLSPGADQRGATPAIDPLFASLLAGARQAVAVVLTGLGRDGARGMAQIRAAGAECLAQDAESCTVYGMPRAAVAADAVSRQLALDEMAPALQRLCFSPLVGS